MMDPLKKHSTNKADEVFKNFPYTIADDSTYNRFLSYRAKYYRKRILGRIASISVKAAAILFIPLAVYTLYNHYFGMQKRIDAALTSLIASHIPQQHPPCLEYNTYSGMQGKILLPDSTEVWLNSCSTLKAPARFDSTSRYVELSGEAYFKVKSNKNWPMLIKTNDVVTRVLGTEFNLSAYNDDPAIKLTLINGKVELQQNENPAVTVKPHEQVIVYDNPQGNDVIRKKSIQNLENELAWKEGYLVFNNTPMADVIKKMERWYGVKFSPVSQKILKYNFTGRFKEESVTRVLDLLSISSNIRYRLNNNTVILQIN